MTEMHASEMKARGGTRQMRTGQAAGEDVEQAQADFYLASSERKHQESTKQKSDQS